jgi:hypothetical protein
MKFAPERQLRNIPGGPANDVCESRGQAVHGAFGTAAQLMSEAEPRTVAMWTASPFQPSSEKQAKIWTNSSVAAVSEHLVSSRNLKF